MNAIKGGDDIVLLLKISSNFFKHLSIYEWINAFYFELFAEKNQYVICFWIKPSFL